ncbi:putative deoxyribonuclease tatdn3 [Globomyces sp. JEL0801]|nr:putative deoxyribonuclease tatdn3 [Globomyces sp. JEL0801]
MTRHIDTHCHLYQPYFEDDEISELLESIEDQSITCFIVTESINDFKKLLSYKLTHHKLFVGLHPVQNGESVSIETFMSSKSIIIDWISSHTAFGIGEIGLDFTPKTLNNPQLLDFHKDQQIQVFREQVKLAIEFNVWVSVHSRQAGHYAIEILQDLKIKKVILHAFDGKYKYVQSAIKNNPTWFFSIPGSIKRDLKTQNMARLLPISNLLIESDAPALGPLKNVKATPLDVIGTRDYIAELKGMSKLEMDQAMELNHARLFI